MDVVRFESCPQGGFGPLRTRFSRVLRCPLDHALADIPTGVGHHSLLGSYDPTSQELPESPWDSLDPT
jgi:hypothetical protein